MKTILADKIIRLRKKICLRRSLFYIPDAIPDAKKACPDDPASSRLRLWAAGLDNFHGSVCKPGARFLDAFDGRQPVAVKHCQYPRINRLTLKGMHFYQRAYAVH